MVTENLANKHLGHLKQSWRLTIEQRRQKFNS